MYSPLSVSQRPAFVPILVVVAIQLLLTQNVSSLNMTNAYLHHKCYVNQGKYKPGSGYEANLKTVLNTISSTDNFRSGYEMISFGRDGGPNIVSVNLQCRGDSYGPKCRSCYSTALSALRKRCSTYKGGIIWYDQCLLEITTVISEGKIDYENNFCMTNAKNVSGDPGSFGMEWMTLLENLTGIVISKNNLDGNKSAALYAAGERKIGTKKIYGMLQCTKDLTFKSCQVCVGYIARHFYKCCENKQGARVLGRSCNFRFEFYPFVQNSNSNSRYLET